MVNGKRKAKAMGGNENRRQAAMQRRRRQAAKKWAWRWALLPVMLAMGVAAQWSVWSDLIHASLTNADRAHIWLAPLACGYIFARRRDRFQAWSMRRHWIGPAVLVLAAASCVIGARLGMDLFWHLSAPLMIIGCGLTLFGYEALRRFASAWLVLFFMVPLPEPWTWLILGVLSEAASWTAAALASVIGLDASWLGLSVAVDAVDETLLIRGQMMALATATIIWAVAFGARTKRRVRWLTALLTPMWIVLFNTLRILGEIVAATAMHSGAYQGVSMVAGWLMLLAVFAGLRVVLRRMEPSTPTGSDFRLWRQCSVDITWIDRWSPAAAALVLLISVLLTPNLASSQPQQRQHFSDIRQQADRLPHRIGLWSEEEPHQPATHSPELAMLRPNVEFQRLYRHDVSHETVLLELIHTGDARDLIQRHPPHAYAQRGYRLVRQFPELMKLDLETDQEIQLQAMVYEFARRDNDEQRLAVVSLYALPGTTELSGSFAALRDAAGNPIDRTAGAAAVQLTFNDSFDAQARTQAAQDLFDAASSLLRDVTLGPEG